MFSKHGCGSESSLSGDMLHGKPSCFQQVLRTANPRSRQPLRRSDPDLFVEPSPQRTGTHARVPRDLGERKIVLEVAFHPNQQWPHGLIGLRQLVVDELSLTAGALQWHHRCPGHIRGDGRAMIAPDHMQAQVHAGSGSSRCEHLAVVHVENVYVHVDIRIAPRKVSSGHPVCCRSQMLEHACTRQDKSTRADGCDTCTSVESAPEGAKNRKRDCSLQIINAGNDYCISARDK